MSVSLRTRSSRSFLIRSTSRLAAVLVPVVAAAALFAQTTVLAPVATRDNKIVRRWVLEGDPRGVAVGADGTIYAGLAQPQAVIAIDPRSGTVKKRLVLDSADIASTKELVTMRTNASRTRLYVANGSDESASILSLPDLDVLREITMEGETIRDAVPDPKGRYVYLLGRRIHIFDADGKTELHTLEPAEPMAIAASANGAVLAVLAPQDFGNAKATVVALYDTSSWSEIARDPLQTEEAVQAAMFANNDRALIALSRSSLFEKPVASKPARAMARDSASGAMRMTIDFGDVVSSDRVCLPEGSGPQIATLTSTDVSLVYAERRCSVSGAFSASQRTVTPASLYGVNAYAVAFDAATSTLVTTERAGFLTIYHVPRPTLAK